MRLNRWALGVAGALFVFLLSACGGGGGGGGSSSGGTGSSSGTSSGGTGSSSGTSSGGTSSGSTSSGGTSSGTTSSSGASSSGGSNTTTLTGTAAKGLLIGATVNVYCGSPAGATLWTGTTDSNGNYAATWSATCTQPVLIVVSANSSTTMISDITGQPVAVPAGFTLKAYATPSGSTTTQNVTPFTDMAATLAAQFGGSGAPSAANVQSAITAIVNTVLNGQQSVFDADPAAPSAITASSSAAQQNLAALLTALEEEAVTLGGVGNLMSAINAQVVQEITLSTSGVITYNGGAGTAANDPVSLILAGLALAQNDPTVLNAIVKGLTGNPTLVGNNCGTSGCLVTAPASPIPAATILLNSLRSNLTTNFSTLGSNKNHTGFLQTQFSAMSQDAQSLAAENLHSGNNVHVGVIALKLLRNLQNTIIADPSWFQTLLNNPNGQIVGNWTLYAGQANSSISGDFITGNVNAINYYYVNNFNPNFYCQTFSDLVGSNGQINSMMCGTGQNSNVMLTPPASLGYGTSPIMVTEYIQVTVPDPLPAPRTAGSGTFTWSDFYYEMNYPATWDPPAWAGAQPVGKTGSGTFTLAADGTFPAGSFVGDVYPVISGADNNHIVLNWSETIGSTGNSGTVSGSAALTSAGANVLSIAIGNGSQMQTNTAGQVIGLTVALNAATPNFVYTGSLTGSATGLDASGTKLGVANASLTLTASQIGQSTPFFTGTVSGGTTNWSSFNATEPNSPTNYANYTTSLTGTVNNAGNTGVIAFSTTNIGGTYGTDLNATMSYSQNGTSIVAGNGTVQLDALRKKVLGATATFTSGGAALNLAYNGSQTSGSVDFGTTQIGVINAGTNEIDFEDGSYISLY